MYQTMMFKHLDSDTVGLMDAMNKWFAANKDKVLEVTHVTQTLSSGAKENKVTITVFYKTK